MFSFIVGDDYDICKNKIRSNEIVVIVELTYAKWLAKQFCFVGSQKSSNCIWNKVLSSSTLACLAAAWRMLWYIGTWSFK